LTFRRRPGAVRREQALASIELAGQPLTYLLKRSSARRGLCLRVNAEGMAQVNAPIAMPLTRIEAFLADHADWLRNQLARNAAAPAWRDGMALPYLGRLLCLETVPAQGGAPVRRDGDRLLCALPESGLQAAVLAWYRGEARVRLAERLAAVCGDLGLAPPTWRLSAARTRWGSLSARGVVGLNWRLVMATTAEIDYVICHELAHVRHRDHSPAYWREVARLCPDFQTARARLRENGRLYLSL
jgi:predicted metal-dependent hydrolase